MSVIVWVDDCGITDTNATLRHQFVNDLGKVFRIEGKGDTNCILQVTVTTRNRAQASLALSHQLCIQDLAKRFRHLLIDSWQLKARVIRLRVVSGSVPMSHISGIGGYGYTRDEYMSTVGSNLWLANEIRFEIGCIAAERRTCSDYLNFWPHSLQGGCAGAHIPHTCEEPAQPAFVNNAFAKMALDERS